MFRACYPAPEGKMFCFLTPQHTSGWKFDEMLNLDLTICGLLRSGFPWDANAYTFLASGRPELRCEQQIIKAAINEIQTIRAEWDKEYKQICDTIKMLVKAAEFSQMDNVEIEKLILRIRYYLPDISKSVIKLFVYSLLYEMNPDRYFE